MQLSFFLIIIISIVLIKLWIVDQYGDTNSKYSVLFKHDIRTFITILSLKKKSKVENSEANDFLINRMDLAFSKKKMNGFSFFMVHQLSLLSLFSLMPFISKKEEAIQRKNTDPPNIAIAPENCSATYLDIPTENHVELLVLI